MQITQFHLLSLHYIVGATPEDTVEDGISKHWAPLNWIKDLVPKKKKKKTWKGKIA